MLQFLSPAGQELKVSSAPKPSVASQWVRQQPRGWGRLRLLKCISFLKCFEGCSQKRTVPGCTARIKPAAPGQPGHEAQLTCAHTDLRVRAHTHTQPTHVHTWFLHRLWTARAATCAHHASSSPSISKPLYVHGGTKSHRQKEEPPVGRKPLELPKDQVTLPLVLLSELWGL